MGNSEAERVGRVRAALLDRYDREGRDLPWRRSRDPYAIWVSETLLQQTRVETALRYYAPFLERWPDLDSLARAEEDQVAAALSGIGYYARVRNLLAAARRLVASGGRIPEEPRVLRALPGVGAYTAGAVASIAFGRPEPALDGNAIRVLARVTDLDLPADRGEGRARIEAFARELVALRPGDVNQALMDLGSELCLRGRPRCGRCPLAPLCAARIAGTAEARPVRPPRPALRPVEMVCALTAREGRLLLRRSSRGRGLWRGLWTLPFGELGPGEEPEAGILRALAGLGLGGLWAEPPEISTSLAFLNRRGTLWACPVREGPSRGEPGGEEGEAFLRALPEEALGLPLPAPFRRVIEAFASAGWRHDRMTEATNPHPTGG
jgi:A/G-specific adenine glycosylase